MAEKGCFWGVKTLLTRVVLCRRPNWGLFVLGGSRFCEPLILLVLLFWGIAFEK